MFEVLNEGYDKVIRSVYLTAKADYSYALKNLVPLINKLDFQRNPLRKSFYSRLENDIINGCIMPFLTIAIRQDVDANELPFYSRENAHIELQKMLKNAFVLDGIQRLNTLSRVASRETFDPSRLIFFNILICGSMDRLLYRMVTLNNGQRPMTARHQIEVLANNMFDFENTPVTSVTEKQVKGRKHGKKAERINLPKDVLIKSYMAFISGSVNIDNQKIIEAKMDELITDQIMDSDITSREIQYDEVLSYVSNCIQDSDFLKEWFSISNNLIGFSSAMPLSYKTIKEVTVEEISASLKTFESAFSSINVSKIKLGMARRRMVKYFFEKYQKLSNLDEHPLLDKISVEL